MSLRATPYPSAYWSSLPEVANVLQAARYLCHGADWLAPGRGSPYRVSIRESSIATWSRCDGCDSCEICNQSNPARSHHEWDPLLSEKAGRSLYAGKMACYGARRTSFVRTITGRALPAGCRCYRDHSVADSRTGCRLFSIKRAPVLFNSASRDMERAGGSSLCYLEGAPAKDCGGQVAL